MLSKKQFKRLVVGDILLYKVGEGATHLEAEVVVDETGTTGIIAHIQVILLLGNKARPTLVVEAGRLELSFFPGVLTKQQRARPT